MKTCPLLALIWAFIASTAVHAADYAWVEGETPAVSNTPLAKSEGWGRTDILSGGKWLTVNIADKAVAGAVPDGVQLSYDLELQAAGATELWVRVGFEFVRSDFEWRVDGGAWSRVVATEHYTTDLMEVQRWNEVAWLKLGERELAAGTHRLDIRLPVITSEAGKTNRILFTLDAICFYQGTWLPNGKHKPDADWQTPVDKMAASLSFSLPRSPLGERSERGLTGPWQAARFDETEVEDRTGPLAELPDLESLHWRSMQVPSIKEEAMPDWVFCHRYLLRTRVRVPAEMADRSFILDFAEAGLMATVFVNGQRVAFSDAHLSPFSVDVTHVIRPGEANEIVVCMKDRYYGIEPEAGKPLRRYFNTPSDMMNSNHGITRRYDYPVAAAGGDSGLTDAVTLIAAGRVYTEDAALTPSVADGSLGAQIWLANSGDSAQTVTVRSGVVPYRGDDVALTLPSKTVTVPAGGQATVTVEQTWKDPQLWWPDSPHMYELISETVVGDVVVDTRRTPFGFADWDIVGTRWHLNGVPWQFRANLDYINAPNRGDADAALATWKATGQNMFRLRFQRRWSGMRTSQILDFFAANGVPVRYDIGTLDGQHAAFQPNRTVNGQNVGNEPLYRNWQKQARARVKRYRNNPAIFVWELDNEFIYINSRNFGLLPQAEPYFKETAAICRELDPQGRGQLTGGGRALMDQSLPVNGCHYEAAADRHYPDMAYGLGLWTEQSRHQPWPMALDRPIFLSEEAFLPGRNPSRMAGVGGEVCFGGKRASRDAYGLLLRMYSEGYRWQELGGFHFWAGSANYGGDGYHLSWQPVCALIREWDSAFAAGTTITRTVMVRNDTRHADPITLTWRFRCGEEMVDGTSVLTIPPGEGQVVTLEIPTPATVAARTPASLWIGLARAGETVWERETPYHILPAPAPITTTSLGVWDPEGKVAAYLTQAGVTFRTLRSADDLPEDIQTVIVGSDAIDVRLAADPRWYAAAMAQGKRIIVLDQREPLRHVATPADAEVTDLTGRVAFIQDSAHPAMHGLGQSDFFCWSGDHVVYRRAYRKPSRGARSLLHCDDELGYSALLECQAEDGLLILSQVVIGDKLATSPVARQLLHNLINYAGSYERRRSRTAVMLPEGDPRLAMLRATGLVFDWPVQLNLETADVWIVDGTPANLQALLDMDLEGYFARGGRLVVWGLTPEAMPAYRRLTGVDHMLRPFRRESVVLASSRPPVAANLSQSDVSMYAGERIASWMQLRWMSHDVFTHVVDIRDVAPFLSGPGIEPDSNGGSIVNGFDDSEFWKYICYFGWEPPKTGPAPLRYTLATPQNLRRLDIRPNAHYAHIQQLTVTFNDDPATAVTLDFEPYEKDSNVVQEFPLQVDDVSSMTIAFTALSPSAKTVTGIDNIWLYAERPADFQTRVRPLVDNGGLVWYPRGDGGILLNQLHVPEHEAVPENGPKRLTVVTALLRNLDCVFSGQRAVVPGADLAYAPVSLEGICNLYLTADKGFPNADKHDLRALPLDDQRFGGVQFHIRDFKTSPLESAITLKGRHRLQVPDTVAVPVNRQADVVFFLHGMLPAKEWKPRRDTDTPPAVWEYVVHYADGETVAIPVIYGVNVDAWIASEVVALPKAAVAWTAPLADAPDLSAIIYQTQWVNPRPEVAIDRIEITSDTTLRGIWGSPIVLGITTAQQRD